MGTGDINDINWGERSETGSNVARVCGVSCGKLEFQSNIFNSLSINLNYRCIVSYYY
jgi:hypothetical protein